MCLKLAITTDHGLMGTDDPEQMGIHVNFDINWIIIRKRKAVKKLKDFLMHFCGRNGCQESAG